jgi:PLP dependent protein
MAIADNILKLQRSIPQNICLVAISKTRSNDEIMQAYNAGARDFGENKVQEMVSKAKFLPPDIRWHLVGHLQSNKVKHISSFIHLIHSIDSLKLLADVNKEALKNKRIIHCLLQFFIASEETKYGLSLEEGTHILESDEFKSMQNICVTGVMGMASFTEDRLKVRNEFRELKKIFCHLKHDFFVNSASFKELSMGMSGDFQIAIEEGSTIIRLGTSIFGNRN